jgi:hypothetical protein
MKKKQENSMIEPFRQTVGASLGLRGSWNVLSATEIVEGIGEAWRNVSVHCGSFGIAARADLLLAAICCLKLPNADRDAPQVVERACSALIDFVSMKPKPQQTAIAIDVATFLNSLFYSSSRGFVAAAVAAALKDQASRIFVEGESSKSLDSFASCVLFFGAELLPDGVPQSASMMVRRAFLETFLFAAPMHYLERLIAASQGASTAELAGLAGLLHLTDDSPDGQCAEFWSLKLRPAVVAAVSARFNREMTSGELLDCIFGEWSLMGGGFAALLPQRLRCDALRIGVEFIAQLSAPTTLLAATLLDRLIRRQRLVRHPRDAGAVAEEALVELLRAVAASDQDRHVFETEFLRLTALRLVAGPAAAGDCLSSLRREAALWQRLERRCAQLSKWFLHRHRAAIGVAATAAQALLVQATPVPASSILLVTGAVDVPTTKAGGPLVSAAVRALPQEYFSILASGVQPTAAIPKALLCWPQAGFGDSVDSCFLAVQLSCSSFPQLAEGPRRKFSWGSTALPAAHVEITWMRQETLPSVSNVYCSVPQLHMLQALCSVGKGVVTVDEIELALPEAHRPQDQSLTRRLLQSCPFLEEQPSRDAEDDRSSVSSFATVAAEVTSSPFAAYDGVLSDLGIASVRRVGQKKSSSTGPNKGDVLRCEAAIVRYLKRQGPTDFSVMCDAVLQMLTGLGAERKSAVKTAVDSLVGKEIVELLRDGSFAYRP